MIRAKSILSLFLVLFGSAGLWGQSHLSSDDWELMREAKPDWFRMWKCEEKTWEAQPIRSLVLDWEAIDPEESDLGFFEGRLPRNEKGWEMDVWSYSWGTDQALMEQGHEVDWAVLLWDRTGGRMAELMVVGSMYDLQDVLWLDGNRAVVFAAEFLDSCGERYIPLLLLYDFEAGYFQEFRHSEDCHGKPFTYFLIRFDLSVLED